MRAALPVADAAMVLLDRLAMTRQPGPIRSRPVGQALDGRDTGFRIGWDGPAAAPDAPPGRDGDTGRIRRDRVEQLDLDADDRVDAGRLRGGREPDRAVETLVIGDREPGQAQLGRPLHELVRGGGAVEEREVRVAVELGIGHRTVDDRTNVRILTGDSRGEGHVGMAPKGDLADADR